jgi:hypothetical protein
MAVFLAVLMFNMAALFVLIVASVGANIGMRNAFRRRLAAAATED